MSRVEGIAPAEVRIGMRVKARVAPAKSDTEPALVVFDLVGEELNAWQANGSHLRGGVAIVGVGRAGLGEAHGKTEMEILVEAAKAAVKDASTVDARHRRHRHGQRRRHHAGSCRWRSTLGIQPKFVDSTMIGGSQLRLAHAARDDGAGSRPLRRRAGLLRRQPAHLHGGPGRHRQGARRAGPAAVRDPYQPLAPITSTRWPPRATCTSTAPRARSWPRWPWRRASGRG